MYVPPDFHVQKLVFTPSRVHLSSCLLVAKQPVTSLPEFDLSVCLFPHLLLDVSSQLAAFDSLPYVVHANMRHASAMIHFLAREDIAKPKHQAQHTQRRQPHIRLQHHTQPCVCCRLGKVCADVANAPDRLQGAPFRQPWEGQQPSRPHGLPLP